MNRALVLLCLLSGCGGSELCGGYDGTCVGLRVVGAIERVDELVVRVRGAATLDGSTPRPVGLPMRLPVSTALHLAGAAGDLDVQLEGRLSGSTVGSGMVRVTVAPGEHVEREVQLRELASSDDLAVGLDRATVADMTVLTVDGATLAPRRVFLLSGHTGILGTADVVDGMCTSEASQAGLTGTYRAIIGYGTASAGTRLALTGDRDIVLPSGVKIATDGTFFTPTHLAPINELASRALGSGSCVWTNFSTSGSTATSSNDCLGWTSGSSTLNGTGGDPNASNASWAETVGTLYACTNTCHVYCIEQ